MLVILATVVAMVADGMTVREILDEHPDLEAEDIAECLSIRPSRCKSASCRCVSRREVSARPEPVGSPSAGKVRNTNISR